MSRGLVESDFALVVDCVSQLLGEDLFSYLSAWQDDLDLRSKYFYRFDDGQVAYDCSLGEKFVGPMIPLVIKKIITCWDNLPASWRRFQSEFAKKAWSELLAYEEIRTCLRDRTTTSSRKRSLISFPVRTWRT